MGPAPICMMCKRYHWNNQLSNSCDAFPGGIPEAILTNQADHRRPYKGDKGMMFISNDEEGRRYAAEIFGK